MSTPKGIRLLPRMRTSTSSWMLLEELRRHSVGISRSAAGGKLAKLCPSTGPAFALIMTRTCGSNFGISAAPRTRILRSKRATMRKRRVAWSMDSQHGVIWVASSPDVPAGAGQEHHQQCQAQRCWMPSPRFIAPPTRPRSCASLYRNIGGSPRRGDPPLSARRRCRGCGYPRQKLVKVCCRGQVPSRDRA